MTTEYETLLKLSTAKKTSGCGIQNWANTLTADKRKTFDLALHEPRISATVLYAWAETHGLEKSFTLLRGHRNGICPCRTRNQP